jgi:Caspase domain
MLKDRVPLDGLLVVAFSGHGVERGGVAYLLPSDAEMGSADLLENTSISELKLRDSIKHVGVKQVIVLLDACRDNPEKAKAVGDNNLTPAYRMKGPDWDKINTGITALAVLYATEEGHRAYIAQTKKQGYFSMAFVEGISGDAKNEKNEITLGSLMRYLQKRVPKLVSDEYGATAIQKPMSDIRGYLAEDLVVASIPVVSSSITYSVDVRLRPILTDAISNIEVQILGVPVSVGGGNAAAAAGTEKSWTDRAYNGTHLANAFQYSLSVPNGKTISGWSYDVVVRHIQSDGVVKIELSEKNPISMGVRTSVIGNGILSVDVSQAAEGWK